MFGDFDRCGAAYATDVPNTKLQMTRIDFEKHYLTFRVPYEAPLKKSLRATDLIQVALTKSGDGR